MYVNEMERLTHIKETNALRKYINVNQYKKIIPSKHVSSTSSSFTLQTFVLNHHLRVFLTHAAKGRKNTGRRRGRGKRGRPRDVKEIRKVE